MKKTIVIIGLFIVFLVGISLGGDLSSGSSNLFEEAKDQFEEEITIPNNNYEPRELVPQEGIANKVAHAIDGLIDSIINRINPDS